MTIPSESEMNEFVNALQLSIKSKIDSWHIKELLGKIKLNFTQITQNDEGLELFQKLVPGTWNDSHTAYILNNLESISPVISQFLLLTRLNKKNILKLTELDDKYKALAQKIYGTSVESFDAVGSIENTSKIIFDEVLRQKLTIRQLAEKTGLSAVTLSNFKAGKDIRLSNLIKICRILGLKISISRF